MRFDEPISQRVGRADRESHAHYRRRACHHTGCAEACRVPSLGLNLRAQPSTSENMGPIPEDDTHGVATRWAQIKNEIAAERELGYRSRIAKTSAWGEHSNL